MAATLPLAVVALGTLAAQSNLDLGVRAESRAGMVRAIDGVTPVPTADFRLSPIAEGATAWRGLRLNAGYNPELWTRATSLGAAPLIMHRAGAGLTAGRGRGPYLDVTANGMVGDVDFTLAGEQLEQPFGLATQGGVVNLAAGDVTTRVYHRPTDDFDYGVQAQMRSIGTPTVYRRDPPGLQMMPRTEAFLGLSVGRFDRFRLNAAAHGAWPFMFASLPRTPRAHPAYVGVQPDILWSHRWTRTLNTSVRGGALFAYQRLGYLFQDNTPIALPALTLSLTDQRRMIRWASVTTGLNVGVMPLYDPFLLGLTERSFVQLANRVELGRLWRIDVAAQYLALITTVIPTTSRGAELDNHIAMLTGSVRRNITDNIAVEAGGFSGLRINMSARGGPDIAPQVTLYLAISAGFGFDS